MRMSKIKGSILKKFDYHMKSMDIHLWLRENNIFKFKINEDFSVDVFESVNLRGKNLTKIPIQFNMVDGDFDIGHNKLENLKGAPKVVKGDFHCYSNGLESLEGGPEIVEGDFNAEYNNLTNLKHGPVKCGMDYNCGCNPLKTLEFCPQFVGRNFKCHKTHLDNLEGFNTKVNSFFTMSGYICPIFSDKYKTSLKGIEYLQISGKPLEDMQKRWNLRLTLNEELRKTDTKPKKKIKV